MRKICLLVVSLILSLITIAQPGSLLWQKCYGGSRADSARSVAATTDGGFIVAGVTYSNDGNVTGNHNPSGNFSDVWVIKVDHNGGLVWEKTFGGTSFDQANSVYATSDGGAVVAGWTGSNDGDVTGLHGSAGSAADFWVLKIDGSGTLQWQKTLGGTRNDYAQSVKQTADGGYVVAGITYSNDGDVSGNHDNTGATSDFWVVKLNSSGALQWQKCYGGTKQDEAYGVAETSDKGLIVTGVTYSTDGNVNRGGFLPATNNADYWLLRLDSTGAFVWQTCLGGSTSSQPYSVIQTKDGAFVMSGYTYSNNYNVSGNHDATGASSDEWIVKANSTGALQWQFCYGGIKNDIGRSIKQMTDGHLFVTGYTTSSNGDVTGAHDLSGNTQELWTYELNANGYLQWENCFGGSGNDAGYDAVETADSNFVEVGFTASTDGNVWGNHGSSDFWVIKVQSKEGPHALGIENVPADADFIALYPNPAHGYATVTVNDNLIGSWLELTDVAGRMISREQITGNKTHVQTDGLAKGIYLVRVGENNTVGAVKKLVVE